MVDVGTPSSEWVLAAVMTGDEAQRVRPALKTGAEIRVKGSLKAIRRRLKSGLIETGYEVMADSIEIEGLAPQRE
jgi:hypothetical protein